MKFNFFGGESENKKGDGHKFQAVPDRGGDGLPDSHYENQDLKDEVSRVEEEIKEITQHPDYSDPDRLANLHKKLFALKNQPGSSPWR